MSATTKVFINLPSTNLTAAEAFLTALGLNKKADWGWSGKTICFDINGSAYIFYHDHETYKVWLPKDVTIADTKNINACIVTLSAASKDQVEEMVSKAIGAGATRGPNMLASMNMSEEQEANMYSRSVLDQDGNLFEIVYSKK